MAKINSSNEPANKARSKKKLKKKSTGKVAGWFGFLKEVKVEMKKVTWPPRREITGSTTALLVATVLIGLFLGVADLVLAKGIQPAISGQWDVWSIATLALFTGILFWIYRSD